MTVRQRDFRVLFALRNYQAITGHITAYYELPWHGVQVAERGTIFGGRRSHVRILPKISTGVIGAWLHLSRQALWRGGFDKGIRIIIPFEWRHPSPHNRL